MALVNLLLVPASSAHVILSPSALWVWVLSMPCLSGMRIHMKLLKLCQVKENRLLSNHLWKLETHMLSVSSKLFIQLLQQNISILNL